MPAPVTPVPEEQPGILEWLKDKLAGIGKPDEPPPPPADVVPPPDPLLLPPPDAPATTACIMTPCGCCFAS